MQLDPQKNSASRRRGALYSALFLSALVIATKGNGDGGYVGSEFSIQPALTAEARSRRGISANKIQWKKEYEALGVHALAYYNAYVALASAHQDYAKVPAPELKELLRNAYYRFKEQEQRLFEQCGEKPPPRLSKLNRTLRSSMRSPLCREFNFEMLAEAGDTRIFLDRFNTSARLSLIAVSESGTIGNENAAAVNSLGMLSVPGQ